VLQFVVFVFVISAIGLGYLALVRSDGSGRGGLGTRLRDLAVGRGYDDGIDEPQRGRLSDAMFRSIANQRRARASDNAIFIAPGPYVAVASRRDALVILGALEFFDQDINKLIEINRGPQRLKANAPVAIHHVIEDETVPDGQPYLLTVDEARQKQKLARRDSRHEDHSEQVTPKIVRRPDGSPAGRPASTIGGTLIPKSARLRPITVIAPGQSFGRNPSHGHGTLQVDTVSWDHARIALAADQAGWEISDIKSRHGTLVNGRDLRSEAANHRLGDGDLIGFGPDAEYTWNAYIAGYTPTG